MAHLPTVSPDFCYYQIEVMIAASASKRPYINLIPPFYLLKADESDFVMSPQELQMNL